LQAKPLRSENIENNPMQSSRLPIGKDAVTIGHHRDSPPAGGPWRPAHACPAEHAGTGHPGCSSKLPACR